MNPVTTLQRDRDALTGTESRNCYERDILEYDRSYQADPGQIFIFLFADMNNLKSVNGMYGHSAGDDYIRMVAANLLANLKSAEHVYRMGGDEFLAVYRNVEEETVRNEIDRVRESLAREAEKVPYTPMLAMGYAMSGSQYRNLHDVLRVSDYMMYRNKAELKREVALERESGGTRLNLVGLTDRIFDAICGASDELYPYMTNMETNVTRISPAMKERFGLESEFIHDFLDELWQQRIHPEDRERFMEDVTAALRGAHQYHKCTCRIRDAKNEYVLVRCHGGLCRGRDGEMDIFFGYLMEQVKIAE